MNRSELIEQSKEVVSGVYDSIGKIETMEKILSAVQEGSVSILMPDGALVDLNVLSDGQFVSIKNLISTCLEINMNDASKYLERVIKSQRVPATINPDFESEIKSEYKAYYDEERLRQAIAEGKSVKQIAEDFGCQPCNVYDGMRKFGIETKQKHKSRVEKKQENPKMEYPELTVDEARRVYTEGDLSLTGAATYFGVKKSVFHEFVTRNNIFKPVEKPDPYFEMNRMSKDDFKKHMMKGK